MNAPIRSQKLRSPWPRVRLGEIAEHRLGKMLDKAKNTGIPRRYLRNPNVRWFDVDLSDLQEILVEEKDVHKYELRYGDVVICEGGEAGRAALWKDEADGIIFQKAIHRVRVGPNLDARFLIHWLMFDYFNGGLEDYYTGATIKHFTGQDLARYEIPLPPLDEQRRIAAILDKSDALRRMRRRARELIAGLTRSVFTDFFGDPISLAGPKTTVADVSERTQIGPFGSLVHREDYELGGVPLINPMHINSGGLSPSPEYAVSAQKYVELSTYHLRLGDVVMGRRGEMGRCAEVITSDKLLCGTGSLFIRPDQQKVFPVFLQALLSSAPAVAYFERAAAGITMANLNKAVVDRLSFTLPSLAAQSKFLATQSKVINQAKRWAAGSEMFERLFSSLQHRAFSGQL